MSVIRFPGDRFDRHGPDPLPIPQVAVPVADVNDTGAFPNIAAAIDWARKRRVSNDLR